MLVSCKWSPLLYLSFVCSCFWGLVSLTSELSLPVNSWLVATFQFRTIIPQRAVHLVFTLPEVYFKVATFSFIFPRQNHVNLCLNHVLLFVCCLAPGTTIQLSVISFLLILFRACLSQRRPWCLLWDPVCLPRQWMTMRNIKSCFE